MEQFFIASFNATIRFSLLCLAALLAASLWGGNALSVKFALAAMAAAYLSQFLTTLAESNLGPDAEDLADALRKVALAACLLSAALWLLGLFNL